MQEMVELSKTQSTTPITQLQAVYFLNTDGTYEILNAGPSHFSPELTGDQSVTAQALYAEPINLCSEQENNKMFKNKIAIVERGDCTFVDKARRAQLNQALAVIVTDNVPDSSSTDQPMFAMSGDGKDDVQIPVVFLFSKESNILKKRLTVDPNLEINIMQMLALKKRLETLDETNKKKSTTITQQN